MRITPGRSSGNLIDRRGSGGAIGIGLGGLLLLLVGAVFGLDLRPLVDAGAGASVSTESTAGPSDEASQFVDAVLASTEEVWGRLFQQSGLQYPEPDLVLYDGITPTACGTGQAATGPFYCPNDQRVYLDLSFFQQLRSLGASGDFAEAYVIAHEIGHHVQNVEGTLSAVQQAQGRMSRAQANALSVRTELQADCYAGVWANTSRRLGLVELNANDVQSGIDAAAAVGDDRIQQMSGRAVSPESFTHGTSAQRVQAFQAGFQSGNPDDCDTFRDLR